MKTNLHLRIFIAFAAMFVGFQLWAQTPKSVCQIKQAPINRDHVVTPGTVESVSGDDFYLRDGDCSIECDVNDGTPTPSVGTAIKGWKATLPPLLHLCR